MLQLFLKCVINTKCVVLFVCMCREPRKIWKSLQLKLCPGQVTYMAISTDRTQQGKVCIVALNRLTNAKEQL